MSAPIIQQNNDQLGQLANLLKNVSPEFGSGKSTETSKSSTNTGDADELLKQIYASANPNDIDNMVENILNRAKQAFGPAAIGANAAGVRAYSDTTETQLRNEAMARATGEAAQAKLAAVNTAHKTAASVVEAKMQNTRQVTTQKQTGRSPVGTGLLVGLGASVLKNKVKKGTGGTETAGNSTAVDNSSYSRDEYGPDNVARYPGDAGEDVVVSPTPIVNAVDVNAGAGIDVAANTAASVADAADFAPGLEMTDEALATAGGDEVGAAVDELVPDLVTEEGSSALEDIFGGFFADGGVVPGTRAAPGAYEPGVLDAAKNTKASKQTTLAPPEPTLSEPEILSVIKAPVQQNPKKVAPTVEGAAGEGGTTGTTMSGVDEASGNFGSFSPSATGVAMAAMHAASGNLAAAAMSLTASALANALGTSTITDVTAATTDDASLGAAMAAESNAAAADFSNAMAGTGNTGLSGFMSGDFGFSGDTSADASAPDTGGDASFAGGGSSDAGGGSSDGGGSDGGGGGDGFEAGGIIHGQTASDSEGIDRVVIHVTPGEAVLPADTVAALGGPDGIDELIRQTHRKVRSANGSRRR